MIEISHLTKKYGANVAVNDLSLTLEPGNIYGFLGPNGARKSTTMNIITGYIGASSGEVKINGYDINKNPEEAKKCIGYLPEIPPVYGDMKVLEYLKFVAELKKLDSHTRNADISQVMDLTKLHEMKDRLIRNLSKGYRQRVGLAQALLGMPEIIILDEPTVGLDPKQIIEIRDLLFERKTYCNSEFPYFAGDQCRVRSCVYYFKRSLGCQRFYGTSGKPYERCPAAGRGSAWHERTAGRTSYTGWCAGV